MKLEFVSFQAQHFNNNGDQGNIEILNFFAKMSGISIHNSGPSQLAEADFVLIGDASRAAMRFYEPGLLALVDGLAERLTLGKPTLLVGSSYEFFSAKLGIGEPKPVPRISDFASVDLGDEIVVGYQNSDSDLPVLYSSGCFIATKLFGPVLAYNPGLLGKFLTELGIDVEVPLVVANEVGAIRAKLALG